MPKESLLIVGHGLAGAFLAQTFIDRGKQVDVMDGNFPYHSSKVAAGLVNPLIGPKLNPPDQIKKCLLAIQAFNNLRLNKMELAFMIICLFSGYSITPVKQKGGVPYQSTTLSSPAELRL